MSFFVFIVVLSVLAYVPQVLLGDRTDYRMALRHGLAGGFIFTGIDHFLNAGSRYLPMIPDFLADQALGLVYSTGIAELAGAVGLILPLSIYGRLGLPDLRKGARIGLAVMLAFLAIANIHVALEGTTVEGLAFGRWYYWVRLLFQPLFIIWALFVSGVIGNNRGKPSQV